MAYFDTCPFCKANLDPGERCGCPASVAWVSAAKPKEPIEQTTDTNNNNNNGGKS